MKDVKERKLIRNKEGCILIKGTIQKKFGRQPPEIHRVNIGQKMSKFHHKDISLLLVCSNVDFLKFPFTSLDNSYIDISLALTTQANVPAFVFILGLNGLLYLEEFRTGLSHSFHNAMKKKMTYFHELRPTSPHLLPPYLESCTST